MPTLTTYLATHAIYSPDALADRTTAWLARATGRQPPAVTLRPRVAWTPPDHLAITLAVTLDPAAPPEAVRTALALLGADPADPRAVPLTLALLTPALGHPAVAWAVRADPAGGLACDVLTTLAPWPRPAATA